MSESDDDWRPGTSATGSKRRKKNSDDDSDGDDEPKRKRPTKKPAKKVVEDLSQDSVAMAITNDEILSQASDASEKKQDSKEQQKRKPRKPSTAGKSKELLSTMPLLLPKSAQRNVQTLIFQTEDDGVDISGDVGAIGRLKFPKQDGGSSGMPHIVVDLKGSVFRGQFLPSQSFLVVTASSDSARIEGVVDDVLHLQYTGDALQTEQTVSGSLDESSFVDLDADVNQETSSSRSESSGRKELTKSRSSPSKSKS